MNNLIPSRRGFRFDHIISEEGAKCKIVRLDVSYLKGSQRKGINVSIRPTTIEKCEGYSTECFEIFAGLSMWAKLLPRKNDKQVAIVAEQLDSSVPAIVSAFLENPNTAREVLAQIIAEKVTA